MSGADDGNGGGRVLPQAAPQREEVPSWRLLVTLGSAGASAGLLLVFVYQVTLPAIQAYKGFIAQHGDSELAAQARLDVGTLEKEIGKYVKMVVDEIHTQMRKRFRRKDEPEPDGQVWVRTNGKASLEKEEEAVL